MAPTTSICLFPWGCSVRMYGRQYSTPPPQATSICLAGRQHRRCQSTYQHVCTPQATSLCLVPWGDKALHLNLNLNLKKCSFAFLVASTKVHLNMCVRLRRPPFAWFPGVTRLFTSTATSTSRNVHLPCWSPAPKYISTCVYASGDLPLLVSLGRQPQAIFIRHAPSSGMCREHDH